jgi:acylphosphatase
LKSDPLHDTRVRLVVVGAVQGVGFRYAARDVAVDLNVTGWVRNLSDGTVEIVVQGSPESVAHMAAWAHQGPAHAQVTEVVVERMEPEAGSTEFSIRR